MKAIKIVIAVIVVALIVVGGVMIVKKRKTALLKAPLPRKRPLIVETATAQEGWFKVTRDYLGIIKPLVAAKLAPRVTGHILQVTVREGDRVTSGEILARLDNRPFVESWESIKAQLEGAKSSLATQEAIYQRDLMLFKNKAISQEQLDRSKASRDEMLARVKTLEASLKTAELNLGYCLIKAPMSGIITARYQDPGDLAVPGKPILAMEAPEAGYKVVVKVPQDLLKRLSKGATVYLYPDSEKTVPPMKAQITRLYPATLIGSLAAVEIDLPQRPFNLPSGSTLDAELVLKRLKGLIIPLKAILHTTAENLVFAINHQNQIKEVPVEILATNTSQALIKANISAGTRLVVGSDSVLLQLHQGALVKPVIGE